MSSRIVTKREVCEMSRKDQEFTVMLVRKNREDTCISGPDRVLLTLAYLLALIIILYAKHFI